MSDRVAAINGETIRTTKRSLNKGEHDQNVKGHGLRDDRWRNAGTLISDVY